MNLVTTEVLSIGMNLTLKLELTFGRLRQVDQK